MRIIWTLIIGLIAGAVAKLLVPGKDPGGWIVTMLLGLAGAFLARYVGTALGYYQPVIRGRPGNAIQHLTAVPLRE